MTEAQIDISQVKCPICSTSEWKNIDEYRIKPSGMCLCMKCGMIHYPEVVVKSEGLKDFYREEYRDVPTSMNIFSGQRKLHYHLEFLSDLFKSWKAEGLSNPVVGEVGAAFGMFLHWVKRQLPGAQIYGTELTLSFRRNAWHEYGIHLTEELDTTVQYDLLTSYKVAEHIPKIDQELRKYALTLSPKGLLYISVPCWFAALTNFGASGFTLEQYFHKNHINTWTRKLFETLLKKCGLEVVKENHVYYDSTYLCKRNDTLMGAAPEYEDPNQVLEWLAKVKKSAMAYDCQSYQEACDAWPNFPDAQIAKVEQERSKNHQGGGFENWEKLFPGMLTACPNSHAITLYASDICMRYNQWEKATAYLNDALKIKPSDPAALMALSNCFRHIANSTQELDDKIKMFTEARNLTRYLRDTSEQTKHEAQTWIMNDNSRIPVPSEKKKPQQNPV